MRSLKKVKNEKALAALDKITSMVPDSTVHYGTDGLIFARAYYRLGEQEKAEALVAAIKGRIDRNLDWYSRLKPLQISNTLSDIVYNNINPMLLVNNIYQQYDQEKYQLMTDDLLQRAQFFYMQGVAYVGDVILERDHRRFGAQLLRHTAGRHPLTGHGGRNDAEGTQADAAIQSPPAGTV